MLGSRAGRSAAAAAQGGPGLVPLARRLAAAPAPSPPSLPPPLFLLLFFFFLLRCYYQCRHSLLLRSAAPSLPAQPCLSPDSRHRLGPAARPSHVTRGGRRGGGSARPLRRHPRAAGSRPAPRCPSPSAPRSSPAAQRSLSPVCPLRCSVLGGSRTARPRSAEAPKATCPGAVGGRRGGREREEPGSSHLGSCRWGSCFGVCKSEKMSAQPLALLWGSKDSLGRFKGKRGRAGGDWKEP
ncbi:uncharacterized protein LOC116452142 [Corvus moneduloides]|uniref:uncharacterized protein LOC116452142 n=1 Tax=Corvus moneduloides TaxID=1196302 RepID=UPI001362B266|nr:uncharacterized protein LOC116452142 [Corvus moneduloides]